MKKILFIALFSLSSLSFAEISPVSSGNNIQAAKLNEIITLVNELKADNIILKQAVVPVGTVYNSILTLAQYQAENGDCWRPLDGLALATTDELRSLYGYTSIPGAAGRFLRNAGGLASGLGTTQEDEFKSHTHTQQARNSGSSGPYTAAFAQAQSFLNSGETLPSGGSETRPKNLTVNMFIKFKKACNF